MVSVKATGKSFLFSFSDIKSLCLQPRWHCRAGLVGWLVLVVSFEMTEMPLFDIMIKLLKRFR